ncbi:MAG TPA: response regulator [Usitatibacter sp.]|nr:response regulator [Usitatibacter sp.]
METIYIVDDDVAFARGLGRLVEAAGWSARVFPSAAEFLVAAASRPAGNGCVLLDVRMPGMKGPELHRAMLQLGIRLPVIFLTAFGDVPTSVGAMKLGAADFLEKPVTAEVLVGAIRAALERHAGELARDRGLREIQARVELLSAREREVMDHVVAGRLNKQIAADLGISLKTVKAHRAKVMQKMDAASLAALVDMCRDAGLH